MWEKIKSGFSWTWEQIKKHPYLAFVSTLVLVAGAYFVLPIIGISALSIGIAVALCTVGGQVLGGLLGLFGRKIGLIASSSGSPPTSFTGPSIVNVLPADASLMSQPSSASLSLDPEVKSSGTIISSAGTSSNLELRESNSSISLNPASLFKNTPGSIPTLKDMILNHLGIDALIKLKGNEVLFEIAKPTLVSHLLQLVAFGKQDEAEELLNKHPSLLLYYGEVTDNAGRTFENITAFQYAIWAKDRHMWRMLLKYLPVFDAAQQLKEHENEDEATKPDYVKKHGKYFSFGELKTALSGYINYMDTFDTPAFSWTEAERIWTKEVGLDGGAQSRVPVHVVNEYCHPNRSFANPRESFRSDLNLPRVVYFYNRVILTVCAWFRPSDASPDSYSVGVSRWTGVMELGLSHGPGDPVVVGVDLAAMTALDEVRTQEINALKAELIPAQVASLALVPR